MKLIVFALALAATAFAAPTDEAYALEKRAPHCGQPTTDKPCYVSCAGGSGSINCHDSYCNVITFSCVCKCHY